MTVLVADDQASRRAMVRAVLLDAKVCQRVLEAEDGVVALKHVLTERVDLVITDLVMPRMDGRTFVRSVRAKSNLADLPIIMLTKRETLTDKVAALEAGANDYLVTPVEPLELLARTRIQLRIKSLQDQLRAHATQMEQMAAQDTLTGLLNRQEFHRLGTLELKKANRYASPLGLLVADVDQFKSINDEHGHLEGDRVLKELGAQLRAGLRETDLCARYGGEEFVVLLPMTGLEGTLTTAERLRQDAAAHLKVADRAVTISVGVAHVPTHGAAETLEALFERADRQLYEAKRQGRNRVCAPESPGGSDAD
ncbi:MAG: diguanylate cyclase [Myxococcota bacterium]